MPEDEIQQALVGNLHPFRPPRRARGIDDVREMCDCGHRRRVGRHLLGQYHRITIQTHDLSVMRKQTWSLTLLRHDYGCPSILQHQGEAQWRGAYAPPALPPPHPPHTPP